MAKWTVDDIPDQAGRTVLVTGANSGLGLRSAEALASRGARVLMGCRNADKAATALEAVAAKATGPDPTVVKLDLADLASIRACAEEVDGSVDQLHVLMNNAGVMAIPQSTTTDGFEMQFGTNHLGHFALTGLLLPALRRATAPRVVTTSSTAHKPGRINWDDLNGEKRYRKWQAYGQSKLANLLFMRELDRRAGEAGSDLVSVAAHPGYASTHLQSHSSWVENRVMSLGNALLAQSDAAGALPQLYVATVADVQGGDYYGPDRFFEMRGQRPKPASSTGASKDPEAARRLWELSEKLTGVSYEF